MGRRSSGNGGGGSIAAKSAIIAAGVSGIAYPLRGPLKAPVTWSKVSGHANLSVSGSAVALSAGIDIGVAQTVIVRGVSGAAAVEFEVTVTGAAAIAGLAANVSSGAAPGTVVGTIVGVPAGQVPMLSPADGRFVIAGDEATGWKLARGLSAITAGTFNGAISAAGAISGPVTLTIASAPSWVFGNSQLRTFGTTGLFTPAASRLTEVMDIYIPAQPVGARVVFGNFSLEATTLAAGSAREVLPGNANTIDYAVFFTGASGTGTRQVLTFSGQAGAVMADGGFAVTDALGQAFAGGWLRVSITTPSGGTRPQGLNPSTVLLNEYRRQYSAITPALADGGPISGGSTITANSGYFPLSVLVPRAGQKSVLLIGDSLTQQDDQPIFASARGMMGGIVRGLDDETGGRIGVGNFGHHGAQMIDFMSITAGSRRFSQRYALLAFIKDSLNSGAWPFDALWSQGLRNDFSGMTVTDPTDALAQFNARGDAWWAWLAATFPGVPIIQSTVSVRVTADATTGYTTLEGQNPRTLNMGPALTAFNDRVMTQPAPLALVVDMRPQCEEIRPGIGPVWKRTAFTLAGGGTTVPALATGASLSALTIMATTAPLVGDYLVLEPGTPQFEQRAVITAVTNNGGGSYTIACASTTGKTHAAGAVVMTAPTPDGTHAGSNVQKGWAVPTIAAKPQILALT